MFNISKCLNLFRLKGSKLLKDMYEPFRRKGSNIVKEMFELCRRKGSTSLKFFVEPFRHVAEHV